MPRNTTYLLLALTVLAAIVRFATLDLQSFHHDEAVTAGQVIDPSLGATLDQVVGGERSPPLYYVLAWGWSTLFGTGEVGLRSLSALIGTLMAPAAFYAGRALAGSRAGVVAALLFALNPYLVYYSQEARSYILMALFALVALGALAASRSEPGRRSLWIWAAASALAISSHYFAVFLLVPQVLWLVVRDDRARSWAPVAAVAAIGLALAPLALAQQGGDRREGFADIPLGERVVEVGLNFVASEEPDPLSAGPTVDAVQIAAGVAGLALLGFAAYLLARRSGPDERTTAGALAVLAALAVGVPALMALLGLDLLNPRNLIAAILPLLLLGGVAFGAPPGRLPLAAAGATAALFATVVLAMNLSEEMQREDWRGAAEAIGPASEPRIVVVPKNGDDPLELYLDAVKFDGGRFRDGVEVRDVTVLSTGSAVDAPKGFEPNGGPQRLAPLFELRRFRSEAAVSVVPGAVDDVLSERFEVLIDRP